MFRRIRNWTLVCSGRNNKKIINKLKLQLSSFPGFIQWEYISFESNNVYNIMHIVKKSKDK